MPTFNPEEIKALALQICKEDAMDKDGKINNNLTGSMQRAIRQALAGDVEMLHSIACSYGNGRDDLPQKPEKAKKTLTWLAERGHSDARINLADYYREGVITCINPTETAKYWYEQAVKDTSKENEDNKEYALLMLKDMAKTAEGRMDRAGSAASASTVASTALSVAPSIGGGSAAVARASADSKASGASSRTP